MGNRRTLIAVAAIVLAAAAGLGVYTYTSGADKRAEDKVELVDAFVAGTEIPKGTTGDDALANSMITAKKVLAGSIPVGAVTDTSVLEGTVAAATISEGQFITDVSFIAPSEAGGGQLAPQIPKNHVAVTVNVDAERAVANQIAAGDRVDLATVTETGAEYLLEDVKVLSIGTQTAAVPTAEGEAPPAPENSGLITFEVTPDDALTIATAAKAGTLYLTLRPLADAAEG